MPYATTPETGAALRASNLPLLMFFEFQFLSGTLRVTNAAHALDWDGSRWYGFGAVGSVDSITEASDLSANGIALQLSGIDPALVRTALAEKYQGRPLLMWYAPLDTNYRVLANPIGPFEYRIDTMDIELGDTAAIRVAAESRLVDWERSRGTRYTDEEQQRLHPGDLGLQFVPQMAEKQIKWGY